MPYIQTTYREKIDPEIEALVDKVIKTYQESDKKQTRDGLLNYAFTKIIDSVFIDSRYHDYNEIVGMLECCKLEYYRQQLAAYEDLKAAENGNVVPYLSVDHNKDDKGYY